MLRERRSGYNNAAPMNTLFICQADSRSDRMQIHK